MSGHRLRVGEYKLILGDPPWSFESWSGKTGTPHRTANDHYRTLTLAELRSLPIGALAHPEGACLALWSVSSHLRQCMDLANWWGFTFKTLLFVWMKSDEGRSPPITFGKWSRQQCEVVLLFTRGNPRRLAADVRQIIWEPRREHSRKPNEVFARLERLCEAPRIELFARERRPGWDAWGNEIGKFNGGDHAEGSNEKAVPIERNGSPKPRRAADAGD